MNQILETKKNKNKILRILKIQIFTSILGILCVCAFFYTRENSNSYSDTFSKILSLNTEINSIYKTQNTAHSNIFGKIEIPKIGLDYIVFNEFTEELLKLSPCKFYGPDINKTGNIAIAGHNYDNHTFFSDINKLSIEDEIYLYSNDNIKYIYSVYKTYETFENDLECLKSNFINSKELTLITCNNSNRKRLIVKAIIKNNF